MISNTNKSIRFWIAWVVLKIFSWLIVGLTNERRGEPKGMSFIHKAVFEYHEDLKTRRSEIQSHDLYNSLNGNRLHYCDVGARGGAPNWLLPYGSSLKISLFEPNKNEFGLINEHFGEAVVHRYSIGVGNPDSATLHITNSPGLSSLLKPFGTGWSLMRGDNLNAVQFKLEVQGTQTIQLKPLSSLVSCHDSHIDILKIDVQGYEYEVLEGLGEHRPMLIQCEVSSVEIYQKQKTMGAIFAQLEGLGYFPAKFMPPKNFCHISADARRNSYRFHGDVIFIPDYSIDGGKIIDRWPEGWRWIMELWNLRNIGQNMRPDLFKRSSDNFDLKK